MRQLDSSYLTAAKTGGRYPNIKTDIAGAGTITGKDAILECHIMIGDSSKPSFFETALALSSECRITVDRRRLVAESAITSGKKVVVYASFDNPSGAEIAFAKLGTFYITSYQKIDNIKGLITASDFMLYTGQDFNPEFLTYPCTISDMFNEAFRQSGLTGVTAQFDIDPHIKSAAYKSEKPVAENMLGNPYTCRDVIARIAGMNLGGLYIDADEVPQIYKYQQGTLADTDIIDIKIGAETYYVSQILVFKTEERMAKKKSKYRQLPYAPRFEDMDDISAGSSWVSDIETASARIRNKPWTTATVTIRGIGQIEPGDFVTAAGTTLLVTGIKYDFVNACFNETLYSYAYTEEEYLMAPQKSVDVSTGASKPVKGGVGENVGYHNERFNGYTAEDGCVIQGANNHDYNHAEGYKNTLTACEKTHVSGGNNTVTAATGAEVFGRNNTVTGIGTDYILGGYNNEVRAGISGSAIFGSTNKIYENFTESLMAGQSNQVLSSTDYTIVVGNANTVIGGSGNQIFGQSHYVRYADGINHCLVCGTAANSSTLSVGAHNIRFLVGNAGNIFCIGGDGDTYAAGGYHAMGADYAEYFEWADGNPENEDRCGMLVALDGDKIVPADGYDILGAVSADPSVVGNSPDLFWRGKYARDIYGRIIHTPKGEALINPDYDPEQKYIPRSARPEWSAVGLVGRLIVRDNGSCKAGEWVVGNNGYAFPCLVGKTNVRCLKRIDGTRIEVLIK